MNHNEFKQMIQLSLYGELSDDKQKKLISHLESCEECKLELEQQKSIMMLIADHRNLEVNEELLKEARIQLRGALRQERNNRSSVSYFTNHIFQLFSTPPRLAFAALSVLILGIIIGSIFIGRGKITAPEKNPELTNASMFDNDLRISNVQFIDSDPTDGEIEFTFEVAKQVHYKGSVNDPKVQGFLTYAMLNDQNPGSRLNSINAMDTYKKLSLDKEVKNALITVVMTDKNAGVRREALKLMNRTAFDESLKQAYLYVLLNDSSSALRIEALNALIEANKNGHSLDRNDLDLVVKQANQDDNNYIKLKSKTLLQEYN
ncbi:MAG: zf-HC2 domain-containing protein [Ignavibacteriaceae bacterium]|nr:zf-HC2 domain-containing protein [Ignavibacteriaceae bacterium]